MARLRQVRRRVCAAKVGIRQVITPFHHTTHDDMCVVYIAYIIFIVVIIIITIIIYILFFIVVSYPLNFQPFAHQLCQSLPGIKNSLPIYLLSSYRVWKTGKSLEASLKHLQGINLPNPA